MSVGTQRGFMIAPGSVRSDWMDNVLVNTAGDASRQRAYLSVAVSRRDRYKRRSFLAKLLFFMQINKFPI